MLASVDHIVLTTRDLERCLDFYTRVLGMTVERYGAGRIALNSGRTNSTCIRLASTLRSKPACRRRARSTCVSSRTAR